MAVTRDELREHLVAAIEASQELGSEDRRFLADNFLDELERRYDLVPRGQVRERRQRPSPAPNLIAPPWRLIALVGGLVLLAPFILFAVAAATHPPFFLLIILFFLFLRFSGFGWRRRPPMRW